MANLKKICGIFKKYLMYTEGAFGAASLSILMMTFLFCTTGTLNRAVGIVTGISFWLFGIIGLVFVFLMRNNLAPERMAVYEAGLIERQRFPGIFTFSRKPVHIALYAVVIVGAVFAVSDMRFHWVSPVIMLPIVGVTLFAFSLHCIIDGKNYKIYKILKAGLKNGENR